MPPESRSHSSRRFPSTQWSLVVQSGNPDPEARRQALESLLRIYWTPLLAHLVRIKRRDAHEAEDLLQGFVADKVIAQELFQRAREGRGRLRNLLLTALDRYCTDRHRFEGAQKRTSGQRTEDRSDELLSRANEPAADSFDVAWARETLDQAAERMREECESTDRGHIWAVFHARLLEPMLNQADAVPHSELAARLNLTSPAQASEALLTAKRIYARCVREVVGRYLADPAEIDDEIRDLQRVLASARPDIGRERP